MMKRGQAMSLPPGVDIEWLWFVEARYAEDAVTRRGRYRAAHLTRNAALLREGRYCVAGAFEDLSASVLLVRAETSDEALRVVRDDPYITGGVWVSLKARRFGQTVAADGVLE